MEIDFPRGLGSSPERRPALTAPPAPPIAPNGSNVPTGADTQELSDIGSDGSAGSLALQGQCARQFCTRSSVSGTLSL